MVRVELADQGDDEQLRQLVKNSPMPGAVQVAYTRETSFFDTLCVHGHTNDVIVGRESDHDMIVGLGMRSIKPVTICGAATTVGYLSALRLLPGHRGGRAIARGMKLFRQLHEDRRADLYLTTILESNGDAAKLLTSRRLGLPQYEDFGRYRFWALSVGKKLWRSARRPAPGVRFACDDDLGRIFEFFSRVSKVRQFFPSYSPNDLACKDGLLRGLSPQDIVIAEENGRIVGTVALWDQSFMRQALITGYSRRFAITRKLYNTMSRLRRAPRLPRVGAQLPCIYLALCASESDDVSRFQAMLSLLFSSRDVSSNFVFAGFHERDPLQRAIATYPHISYDARLYVAFWPEQQSAFERLDSRIPYLEPGGL